MTSDRKPSGVFGAVVRPLQAFLHTEAASGVVLLATAVIALIWSNAHPDSYRHALGHTLSISAGSLEARFTVLELINDGLMSIFFFVVGMEIKRELVLGELSSVRKASLPALAALGGMVVPAGIFAMFTSGGPGLRGWGIPMATDIAFCVGVLTLLGKRVPRGLVVFVTALAIFDDIGGILVIALFYGHGLELAWLAAGGAVCAVLFAMHRAHVSSPVAFGAAGLALWYALHHAGIHATIAGVILGMAVPARPARPSRQVLNELAEHVSELCRKPEDEELDGAEVLMIEEKLEDLESPIRRFVHALHGFVAFVVMPVFALANSGVSLRGMSLSTLGSPVVLGTTFGLLAGKSIGISIATLIAVKLGLAPMPGGAPRGKLLGVAIIAGIGFTVALFIASLAFNDHPELLDEAKLGILLGSFASGFTGWALLRFTGRDEPVAAPLVPAPAARAGDGE